MADNPLDPKKYVDVTQGWNSLGRVVSRHIPYQLTHGGNARKALWALMYPHRR